MTLEQAGLWNRRSRVMPVEGVTHRQATGLGTQSPDRELEGWLETKLSRIAEVARRCPEQRFTPLCHFINEGHLRSCFRKLKADKAAGVDGVSKEEYARTMDVRIPELIDEMKRQAYKPPEVRRVYIPKANGKLRPLGIPTLESKLVQLAMRRILDAIYEQTFLDCSYGFRPNRSHHDALKKLDEYVRTGRVHYIVEADIKGFFDHVNHDWLMKFLKIRIADTNILRLIVRFLKAGVWQEGKWLKSEMGTPQGGVISPLLANVYLHYVLDEWFEKEYRKTCRGKAELIRYADDFITCFQAKEDAVRFLHALKTRLGEHGLEIEENKTRIIPFSPRKFGKLSDYFEFLGFGHYIGRSPKGYWRMKRRTSGRRLKIKIAEFNQWMREQRSRMPLSELWKGVKTRLIGHYRYYGITDNYRCITYYRYQVDRLFFKWLNRRSQKKSMSWKQFTVYLRNFPLPMPRIYVNIYATSNGYTL